MHKYTLNSDPFGTQGCQRSTSDASPGLEETVAVGRRAISPSSSASSPPLFLSRSLVLITRLFCIPDVCLMGRVLAETKQPAYDGGEDDIRARVPLSGTETSGVLFIVFMLLKAFQGLDHVHFLERFFPFIIKPGSAQKMADLPNVEFIQPANICVGNALMPCCISKPSVPVLGFRTGA